MKGQTHQIARMTFNLKIPRNADGYALQEKISRYFNEKILPEAARLFDGLIPANETVQIGLLEIDLGDISTGQFLTKETLRLILKHMKEKITIHGESGSQVKDVRRLPLSENLFDQWLYFLEYGQMPWNNQLSVPELEIRILESLVQHPALLSRLSELVMNREQAMDRLVWQHTEKFLVSLVEIFSGFPQEKLLVAQRAIGGRDRQFISRLTINTEEAEKVQALVEYPTDFNAAEFRDYFWQVLVRVVMLEKHRLDSNDLIREFMARWVEDRMAAVKSGKRTSRENKSDDSGDVVAASEETEILLQVDSSVREKEWYVRHAGIVLLHPFLEHFFEKCKLLRDGRFPDRNSRYRAVHLLYFLASDAMHPFENELHLAKVLCGMAAGEPVPRELKIPAGLFREADRLLKVVIDRWGALGDVSPGSLREGFLERDGKLTRNERGWYLRVEQKPIDLLLGRLPWGLSMFTLPWMKGIVRVDWS
jgi:hypothetical protein